MRLRWDWLHPVMRVPYVPTLGAVHPGSSLPDLFADVMAVAGTGRFLPYDRDARWSQTKDKTVLVDDIVHHAEGTLVPAIGRRGAGTVEVHHYGDRPQDRAEATELAAKLAAVHRAAKARVVWFQGPGQAPAPGSHRTRVQLRQFTAHTPATGPCGAVPLDDCPAPVRETFGEFADKLSADGFAFLHGRMLAGRVGPVLVAVADDRVVGAIGPMEVALDREGRPSLLPQYFGVLPDRRGEGHGRALWRSAMHWGQTHGADYQLLQTVLDGASDRLCRSEGLASLGLVHRMDVRV